jgi:hypothetical protein
VETIKLHLVINRFRPNPDDVQNTESKRESLFER